jgi:putative endopeptidase
MKRALVLATALAACSTPSPAPTPISAPTKVATEPEPAPPQQHGVNVADIDRTADPCNDFYAYANGAWRAANPIPAGKPRWSRRVIARETNRAKLQSLLEEISARTDWPAGSAEQLIGDYYASCMNEASADAAGLAPIAPVIASIASVRTRADVQRELRHLHALAIPVGFHAIADLDYRDPSRTVVSFIAGGLGLPDRDMYLKPDAHFVEVRAKYHAHLVNLLKLGGMPAADAPKAADGVIALEKRLADASLTAADAADPVKTDHKTTFAELERMAPDVDWATYFDEAKLGKTDVNVGEVKLVQQVSHELHDAPIAVWRALLLAQLLDAASPSLAKPFADESFDFKDKFLGSVAERAPRARRCVDSTEALLPDALGKKYVERYFPPAAKAKLQALLGSILTVLKEDVPTVAWMQPETKTKALTKLASYNLQLGYPDTWRSYAGVTIRRDALWANVAAARAFGVGDSLKTVGKTDYSFWALPATSSDAYIDLQRNEMVLPAGNLQAPGFDPDANDAVNYGSVGIATAHDMTHAIDLLGSETDEVGRPTVWWTDADKAALAKRGQCVDDQYDNYFIEPGVHLSGKAVLSESIGDLGGIHLAYVALERSLKTHPVPVIDGFTAEQQFFIAVGAFRGDSLSLDEQRRLAKGDPHPAARFRVIGPLSNLPEFHHAFACKDGAAMVRPAEQRCSIW